MKRQLLFLLTLLCLQFSVSAQNLIRQISHSVSPSLKNGLEEILKDYPNAFRNVMGPEMDAHPQFSNFECLKPLPGSISSKFSRFNTPNGNVVSFEAFMLETEEFSEAAARYKSICRELKRGIINMGPHRPYIVDGKITPPSEEVGFSETVFCLTPSDKMVDKLKIVVSMEYVFPQWELRIRCFDKDDDDVEVHGDEDDEM